MVNGFLLMLSYMLLMGASIPVEQSGGSVNALDSHRCANYGLRIRVSRLTRLLLYRYYLLRSGT